MSVYNGARFLAEAVESVLAQSFADFEFLILDDGSTDGSARIAQAFAARDPRIRVIARDNRGLVARPRTSTRPARHTPSPAPSTRPTPTPSSPRSTPGRRCFAIPRRSIAAT
jgi:cellulose synthase/poly-beta-1,6-N-acetylglucosamine synthase-like glycosyltransferase